VTLLVISPDYASHAFPLLALAGAWGAEGRRVVVATGPAVAPMVEGAGFEWLPLALGRGSNAGVARAEEQPRGEDDNLRAFFAATRAGMLATLRLQAQLRMTDLLWRPVETGRATIEAVRAVQPDSVLVDHLAFGATLGLRAAQVPYADVVLGHPSALPVAGERYGFPVAWPAAFRPDRDELAGLEKLTAEVSRRFTDDWNAALARIGPGATPVEDAFAAHGDAVLYSYPASLHDPTRAARLPAAHAFLGSAARQEELDPEAASWLAREPGRPLVLVSFGSFLSARSDALARVVAALRGLDVRVALATGSADADDLGPLPDSWLARTFLPQVALVRHAAVAVTHGGNNGVTEALTFGVPLLVLPFSTDQFAIAADLERAGLGRALDPNSVTERAVRASVETMLDGSESRAAAALGAELRAEPGPARARRAVRDLLEDRSRAEPAAALATLPT
jgi:zeaxanthin glucosyltransferase